MSMTIIFANSPFDKELRFDCKKASFNNKKLGDICILPNYSDTIFEVKDSVVRIELDENNIKNINIVGSGVVKVKNNTINVFGLFNQAN